MLAAVNIPGITGIEAKVVKVEADILIRLTGLSVVDIVGSKNVIKY